MYNDLINEIALDNKYTRWYARIITNAMTRPAPTGYTEKHHILPKSFELGGVRDKRNIVTLTAREHFVCHWLLTKMFKSDSHHRDKMIYALGWLSTGTKKNKHLKYHTKITSRVFERNRIKAAAIRGIECTINGQQYPNPWQAHQILGIEYGTILSRLRNPNFPEYQAEKIKKREIKTPSHFKKVSINGVVYETFKEANRQTKIPSLFRKLSDERYPEYFFIDEPDRKTTQVTREWRFSVTINGIQYKSVSEAARKLNMKRCEIDARLRDPNDTAFVSSEITADKERTLKESLKKKVVAEGLLFSSMTDAMKTLNLRRDTLKYRLRGNAFRDYYYV
jgi:hypothetical protein